MRSLDLQWNDWSEDHIARHRVEPDEVEQAVDGPYHMRRIGRRRYGLVGQTLAGRYLMVVVDRLDSGGYAVVTARDADADERRLYRMHRRR